MHRKIDEVPSRAELIQYQKRFIELYRQSRCIDRKPALEAGPQRDTKRGALSHLSVVENALSLSPQKLPPERLHFVVRPLVPHSPLAGDP